MKLPQPRHATLALCCALLVAAAPGSARAGGLDEQTREELSSHVQQVRQADSAEAKQVALMAWGLWAGRDAAKELASLKTSDEAQVRLGAGLGLMLAGQRGAQDFVLKELGSNRQLYVTLRDQLAVLDDDLEVKLLDALTSAELAEVGVHRDVSRYLAQQDGALLELLARWARAEEATPRRGAALEAMRAHARPAMVAPASALATHKDPALQRAGVDLLLTIARTHEGARGQVSAPLARAVKTSKEAAVIEQALRGLLELNDASAASLAIAQVAKLEEPGPKVELLRAVRQGLERGLEPDLEALEPLLKAKPSGELQILVYQLAAAAGDKSVAEKMYQFFGSNDYSERLLAVRVLGYVGGEKAANMLTRGLFEGKREMRLYSAQSLGGLAAPSTLPALQKAISRERDPEVKLAVIRALGSLPEPTAARLLRLQVTSRDPKVKLAVIEALREQGLEQGVRALEQFLRERDPKVRWRAFVALLDIDSKAGMRLARSALRSPPESFVEDLSTLEASTQEQLFPMLARHDSASVRPQVLSYMLARRERFEPHLLELLQDRSYRESDRMNILASLAQRPSKKTRAIIEKLARTARSQRLARLATWFVARDAEPSLEAAFRGMLTGKDPVKKALAIWGLASIKKST